MLAFDVICLGFRDYVRSIASLLFSSWRVLPIQQLQRRKTYSCEWRACAGISQQRAPYQGTRGIDFEERARKALEEKMTEPECPFL